MELKDFAEQLLFSPEMKSKLFTPLEFSDNTPGKTLKEAPHFPAREAKLSLSKNKERAKFPSLNTLHQDHERAKVMHFLANHELLALELMALTLLRFPDAPKKFRMGVAQTIVEEQEHLRLYLKRMNHLGMQFGDLPLNDFFWNKLSGMKTPMDYVTGLSMTFEQCNLDFSEHYQKLFTELQDEESRSLMEKVYLEEIGHVKHGLHWFDQWKKPEESRWDSYLHHLPKTLSPSRAKGEPYSSKARELCGLDQDFINRLEIHSESKGKNPDVFLFNPLAELEASGRVPKKMAYIEKDLEMAMLPFCGEDDLLLCHELPRPSFLKTLKNYGLKLPQFQKRSETCQNPKVGRYFQPWALSPTTLQTVEALGFTFCDKLPSREQLKNYLPLHSKQQHGKWHQQFLRENKDLPQHPLYSFFGKEAKNYSGPRVIKPAFSTSGRGFLWLKKGEPLPKPLDQNSVIEPALKRVADYSLLFTRPPEGGPWKFRNSLRFLSDEKGKYLGHYLKNSSLGLDAKALARLSSPLGERKVAPLKDLGERWENFINTHIKLPQGVQKLGIDLFLMEHEGNLFFHYCSEFNLRTTFGHLAMALEKKLAPKHWGFFALLPQKRAQELSFSPPVLNKNLQWGQGLFHLTDIEKCEWTFPCVEVNTVGTPSQLFT